MVFDSEHYNVFMYVAISVVVMFIVLNSVSLVETGLSDFEKNSNSFGRGLTGLVVENIEDKKVNSFDGYLEKVIENEKPKNKFNSILTGFAVSEDEEIDQEKIDQFALDLSDEKIIEEEKLNQELSEGELYTEGSYMIYYTLLGFFALCIFIITAIFFLPKLKDYS